MEKVCPDCGGPVQWDLTCHTWPGAGGRWMSCLPCDSAVRYDCMAGEDEVGCGWSYTHGLNPRNPRAAANEAKRPAWLPEKPDGGGLPGPAEGVKSAWDD